MAKVAFIYAGQGAQYAGMGKDLYQNYKEAAKIFEIANESIGFDIARLCFEGPDEELMKTENTQPAVLTMSIACLKVLESRGFSPDVAAGLSLGEYSALVNAGALRFEDAVPLVKLRGKLMQETVPLGKGGMAAIIGLTNEAVVDTCKEASAYGVVEPANFNCPGQITIAGEIKALEKAIEIAKEKGAKRAIMLPVSAPFHCSMLKPAGEKLEEALDKIEFSDLKLPVISNVNARYIMDKSEIKNLLVRQVYSSVLWEATIERMIQDGVDVFVELGPGKTLSGFIKKIDKTKMSLHVEDMGSLEETLKALEDLK
ncbi:ACP S-malonyltransferase [Caldanaerobius polysaccharolyticus]|uniref:ACP S-malonyltransferase n=1 Tax=Caldanaerobius polysaccharolyticus TaxID=44256 RepID=UPI00047AAB91|nr:ACP S-malonyltransferase [Caldanaerobius polysaccharolyticus]